MTKSKLEEKIEEIFEKHNLFFDLGTDDAMLELAAYVREETLREVKDTIIDYFDSSVHAEPRSTSKRNLIGLVCKD